MAAGTPEPKCIKFQCSSPFLGTVRIPQDQQTPRSTFYATDENQAFLDSLDPPSERLSDVHLAFRKANETAARRSQAASWLQKMVGPLNMPSDPSEEELRLCLRNGLVLCNLINKIHPGAVLKIVENPALSSPPPQGPVLSAYQYFENVRNFLVAVEELKLPSFQASDLEKGSLQTGSSAKVVNCILALKAYHEWQLKGGQGLWRFAGVPYKSPCSLKSLCRSGASKSSDPHQFNQIPKPWAVSGFDGTKNLFNELTTPDKFLGPTKRGIDFLDDSERTSSKTDFSYAWVEHVSRKFDDELSIEGEAREVPSEFDIPSSESLSKLVMIALRGKKPEEVPMLVESMLRKVVEEFEQRLEQQLCKRPSTMLPNFSVADHSEQQSNMQALQMELDRLQSIDRQRRHILLLQMKELKFLKQLLDSTRFELDNMQGECKKDMEALETKVQAVAQAAAQYHKVLAENRDLYNQVQDLKGNIRVFCRVRPFLPGQIGKRNTVDFVGEDGSIVIANPSKVGKDQRSKSFTFNRVFGPAAAQEEVFLDTRPLIRSVLDGFNVCIFAYGQTGSGKTHTMTGPNNPSPTDWGVNFRALNDLFLISQNRQDYITYEVGVQMMEIYNEQVRDLLCLDGTNKRLEIRNSSQQNGLNVPDASLVAVMSTEDVLELMSLGHKNRAVGATALNERSSRSHSVLTVHVKGTDLESGAILRGCLHLVDLAGSERVDKSEATGDRLKEAQHINKSLSALGDVISALAQKNAHVPYRNSKLTQLLQDSLGGQAKTLMFVHISPDEESYLETMSTLKFAERVASVELGAAHLNKESGDVRDLKDQIVFLKDVLAKRDAELERFQRESKCKPLDWIQERSRIIAIESPGLRTSVDAVQSQGKRRQPLEEVRNLEVRHSSANISQGAQKRLSSTGMPSIDLSQTKTPSPYGTPCYEYDDDTVKRRASKEGRYTPSSELDTSSIQSFSKNKMRRESSVQAEALNSINTPQGRRGGDIQASSGCQNDTGAGQALSLHLSSDKKGSEDIFSAGITTSTTCTFEGSVPRLRHSYLKPFSSEGMEKIPLDFFLRGERCDESGTAASQCTYQAETWAAKDTASLIFKGNKQHRTGESRASTVKQSLSSLPKTEHSAPAAAQRRTRSRRLSLLGGNNITSASEVKKSVAKASISETKLVAENGTADCLAKASLPRQTPCTAPPQKTSKRWM
ncbi:hypothetical protein L7F22_054507 [Adiantum nelumboides]|nr:hypothetical protein [Adiantum nelumboides]